MQKHSNTAPSSGTASAVSGKVGPAPGTSMSSSKLGPAPRLAPTSALPASKPANVTLQPGVGNMTMTRGPLPATGASSTAEPVKTDIMGPGKGPAPKIAADETMKRLSQSSELPDPPSMKPAQPPKPPTAFKPKNFGGAFMRSGATQGTTT